MRHYYHSSYYRWNVPQWLRIVTSLLLTVLVLAFLWTWAADYGLVR